MASRADGRLIGKVAIITGGAGSIGSVTAQLFASHGANVIIADLDIEKGEKVAQHIGRRVIFKRCNVAIEDDVAAVVDFAVEKFGKLDIMYNNAGVASPLDTFGTLDMAMYDRCTSINVRGVVVGTKHAARVMVPRKQGTILNTASIASISTGGTIKLIYNMNKMNLPGITKIAAYHLGKHGIRVNCISPTVIPTEMFISWHNQLGLHIDMDRVVESFQKASPLAGKMCTVQDVAKGALFLCSDDSGYVSGQNLVIDAGSSNIIEYDPMGLKNRLLDTNSASSSVSNQSGETANIAEFDQRVKQFNVLTSKL